jgi:hypothetical protein
VVIELGNPLLTAALGTKWQVLEALASRGVWTPHPALTSHSYFSEKRKGYSFVGPHFGVNSSLPWRSVAGCFSASNHLNSEFSTNVQFQQQKPDTTLHQSNGCRLSPNSKSIASQIRDNARNSINARKILFQICTNAKLYELDVCQV